MESRKAQVGAYTAGRIEALLRERDGGAGKAALAELRRGVGHVPGELPKLWGQFLMDLPEEMLSPTGEPSREEWAVYAALTLWAMHQQGKEGSMHCKGVSLGEAAGGLLESQDDMERVWRRLNVVAQAEDMPALAYHLRSLVQLLKASDIAMDYAGLSQDLYDFQRPETVNQVRLRWGQKFFHAAHKRFAANDDSEAKGKKEE
ncbi:MAG: type I-E CRISPR-associated protein Cse2/CasB [Clostridiales bacterium]|nr:type I-E CRISPR-associated protein Cse2/CasB [Clostridiales bacterium]MDO4349423.1 type I-E CRISPR-associated protein Cse2/CasB [Eubacteriales bacterium]MDY4008570.1 type I-E CRISPR-associated protein Cse2/CasB [Candidatus Limiplasma sp.]